jgi:hypothetical protein
MAARARGRRRGVGAASSSAAGSTDTRDIEKFLRQRGVEQERVIDYEEIYIGDAPINQNPATRNDSSMHAQMNTGGE